MITIGGWLSEHADLERLDRDLLLAETLGTSRAHVMAHPERVLRAAERARLSHWAARRRRGEPLAYILGRKEFWGLTLRVNPAVLIPRPETELLVEQALRVIASGQRILDLGTGSGAVAIALAKERAHAEIVASDVSQAAVRMSAANAAAHDAPINFVASHWFTNISGRFHVIASNPPYVANDDPHLSALAAEPRTALAGGPEGLDAIRYIVPAARAHLHDEGWLLIEHGHDQGRAVRTLMARCGYTNIETFRDLAGRERVSRGQWQPRDSIGNSAP